MPALETYFTFCIAALLLSLSPGPSNLYIMARSISQGPKAGFSAAGGLAIGSVIYALATALGIAAIFKYSPLAYTLVKLGGATYLLYLGWQYLRAEPVAVNDQKLQFRPMPLIFRQSIVVELTNPKTALFFLAFLPQFVKADAGDVTTQLMVLGFSYALIALCCDLFVAFLSGSIGQWLRHHPDFGFWQDRISGTLLIGLGGYIALEELS